jgi:signal transduction histidine kinase
MQLTREPVSLQTVVREAVSGVGEAAAAKGITLHVEAPDAVHVIGDRARLRQIVAHLVANGVKFTEPGGSASVRLGVDASSAIIQVADTGIGLTPAMLPRVFDGFRQGESGLTRSHGGLGIGLTIVRHLVALHGGTVEVASPGPHRGTTFTVRLPRGAGP